MNDKEKEMCKKQIKGIFKKFDDKFIVRDIFEDVWFVIDNNRYINKRMRENARRQEGS